MIIAFTHNLKQSASEEEAEFDTLETVTAIRESLTRLGHQVELVEVGGPASLTVARLEALNPDVVFNTAEGRFGRFREAFYPAIFEQLGIPFTGSDAYVCTLTLDKQLTKQVVAEHGLPVPRSKLVLTASDLDHTGLRFPLIVKPNYEGSSKGVTQDSVVEDPRQLKERAAAWLKRFPSGLLVEEYIEGKDVTVGWMEGVSPETGGVLPPAEYIFAPEAVAGRRWQIYDYHLKNEASDKVDVRVPADVPAAVRTALVAYARTAAQCLGLRDFGRIDFRVTPDNEIYFIEVNALPSLEPGAGIYAAAALCGLNSVDEVLEAIIATSERRFGVMPRAKSRRGLRKLRVGFAYNEKRIKPGDDPSTDTEVEYDAPKTLDAIRQAIASYGHEVVDLEATPEFPQLTAVADVDVVFNVAEGIRGRSREASIPAILELQDIPYTGSDAATMALTLDKGLAKRIVRDAGVRTPRWLLLETGKERVPADLPFPLIVKPVAEGSSKGVLKTSIVHNEAELREVGGEIIRRYRQAALAEEFMPGREFTVALLGENRPRVLPPMEIIFGEKTGKYPIYTYHHKLEPVEEIRYEAPAKIDDKLRNEIERVARRAWAALDCRDVARIDIRLDSEGRPNFIECNPLPGLTPGWSDLCLICESANIDYRTLIGEILSGAIRRFKEKRKLLMQAA